MKVNIGPYTRKRERQISVQIEHFDMWNLDLTFAQIIHPALVKFREQVNATPGLLANEGNSMVTPQASFDFYVNDDKLASNIAHEKWKEILDKMIWSFEKISKNEDGFDLVIELDNGKRDYSELLKHEAKIQEGLDLFGKYYQALWD